MCCDSQEKLILILFYLLSFYYFSVSYVIILFECLKSALLCLPDCALYGQESLEYCVDIMVYI